MTQRSTVLIIDDSATSCHVMETILQNEGYQVKSVGNGREGLMMVLRELPHCVILDVVLPGMSGFEVCRNLRANDSLQGLPVIMVSTKSTPLDKTWALRQGATHYLVKPFENNVFAQLVKEVINNYVPSFFQPPAHQSRTAYSAWQSFSPGQSTSAIPPVGEFPAVAPYQTYGKIPAYRPVSAVPSSSPNDHLQPHSPPLHKLIPLRNQGADVLGGNSFHGDDYIRKLYEAIDGQSDIETLCSITQLSREVVMKGLRSLLMQRRIRLREPNGNVIHS